MSVIPNHRGNPSSRQRATSISRTKRNRREFALEALEQRVVLSYTFNLAGGIATATQDAGSNGDQLIIEDVGGFLEHAVVNSANPTPVFSGSWGGFSVPDTPSQVVTITQAAGAASVAGFPEGVTFGTPSFPADLLLSQNISVSGAVADSAMTVDDSTGTTQATGVNEYSYNGVTFHGPGAFSIHVANFQSDGVTLLGSNLDDTFSVPMNSPNEPVNFVGGSGANIVNVGTGGLVSGINAPMASTDPNGGTITLNVLDAGDTTSTSATLDNASGNATAPFEVTGLSPAPIEYGVGVTALTINGGAGGGPGITYNINNTQTGTTTTINDGAGPDTVNVGDPTNTQGLINVAGPVVVNGGGNTAINVNDNGALAGGDTYTVTVTTVTASFPQFGGLTYAGASALTLNTETGDGSDVEVGGTANGVPTTINSNSSNATVNVNGTGTGGTLTVNTTGVGTGSTVNVIGNSEPTAVNLDSITPGVTTLDTVNIGSPVSPSVVTRVQGAVTITNIPDLFNLNFNDQDDATGQTWTLDTDNVGNTASVQSTGSALVSYRPGDLTELTVNGGTGGNTFNVNNTAASKPTSINAGLTGTNAVNVFATGAESTLNIDAQGSASNTVTLGGLAGVGLQDFLDASTVVNVSDSTGSEALTLDDSQDSTGQTASLFDAAGNGSVTGLAPATINFKDLGLLSLTINGGSGGNTFTVVGTPANVPTTLNTGFGTDTTNVLATTGPALLTINGQDGSDTVNVGNAGSLAGILGPIDVTNEFDFTDLEIDGSSDTNAHDINLSADPTDTTAAFTGLAPATITYRIDDISQIGLTLGNAGAASNNLTVDFSNGNPIQFLNNPGFFYDAGSGADNTLNLQGDLAAAFGGPGFANETHDANGAGFGDISFTDNLGNRSGLTYTGLTPINDTATASNYTFNDNASPDGSFNAVDGPTVLGFNTIQFNSEATPPSPPGFETTNIANKTNVVFNASAFLVGVNGTVNIPTASTGLSTLTFNTIDAAPNDVSFVAEPAGVVTSYFGGTAADTTNVTGKGVPTGTTLDANGGAGLNTLNYDAGGLVPTVIAGALPGEVIISLPGFGSVDAVNYSQINITDVGPLTVTPTANPINTVEGFNYVNAPVGTFTTTVPAIFPTAPAGPAASAFTATVDWGDPSPDNTGGTILQDATNSNNYFVSGSHTYAENGSFADKLSVAYAGGSVTETVNGTPVSVTFPANAAVSATSTATVTQGTLAVTAFPIVGTEGEPIVTAPNPIATFIDAGGAAPIGDYSATITVIDSGGHTVLSVAAASITQIGNSAEYNVNAPSLTLPEEGTYQLLVEVTDSGGTTPVSVTGASQAVIADAPLTAGAAVALTGNTGQELAPLPGGLVVGNFTDGNTSGSKSDFTAVIDWGDGSPNSIGTIGGSAGAYTVSGDHSYASPGTYDTTIIVKDAGGSQVTLTGTATVTDAAVTGAVRNFSAVEGQSTGSIVLATFTDPDLLSTAASVTATLPVGGWGDGTPGAIVTLPVQLVGGGPAGNIFEVLGSHTYAAAGTDTVNITVTTTGGVVTTLTPGTATVVPAAVSATGATVTGIEGNSTGAEVIANFHDENPNATVAEFTTGVGSVVVNWGDGTAPQTLPASAITASGTANGVNFTVTAAHTYAEEGTYAVNVTVTSNGGSATATTGAVAVSHGTAVIADAPLTASAVQPVVSTTEGQPFSGSVASFTDANPKAPIGDFTYVSIDWGDGSPNSVGTISQTAGVGTAFFVSGTHTYANTGTTGPGTFPITVQVHDIGGSTLTIGNSASVAVASSTITGTLNPASDSGLSNGVANVTSVTTPNFYGSVSPAVPHETVTLTATDTGNGTSTVIGRATTNASGDWNVTSVTLPQGTYTITAVATDPTGNVTSAVTTITPKLVIDTTGPKVENVAFDRAIGTIYVTYEDPTLPDGTPGSGVSMASITDAANYSFTRPHTPTGAFLITGISPISTGVAGQQEVALTINGGKLIKGGFNFNFTIDSQSAVKPSGVQDIAENAMDGEFYGTFPSGNGINGGDFNARLVAFHNQVLPPITTVGTASPVTGTGTGASKRHVKAVAPATTHHDVALSHVNVKHIGRHK